MEKNINHIELVQLAQHGDKEALNHLAEAIRERLYAFVYRYTLADSPTQDIVQETILKMLKALNELRDAEKFWPWLYRIATNQVNLHRRTEQRHKTISDPDTNPAPNNNHTGNHEVIADMVYQEFKDGVFEAMRQLKPEHRSVIHMRCYDQMRYSEIAQTMECSEFAAQKLFFRAKNSLKKHLIRRGLGKGSLLMALIMFGKLTAPTEAAAMSISVTGATVKVGMAATITSILATKTMMLSLTAAGALTVGTAVVASGPDNGVTAAAEKPADDAYSYVLPQENPSRKDRLEYWYYYPSKTSDTVMMKVVDTEGKDLSCRYLQNAGGNYFYDNSSNTLNINNYHMWQKDLSVLRLPTDSLALTDFLAGIDGKKRCTQEVCPNQSGTLLMVRQPEDEDSGDFQITRHTNVLGEDYFKYDWPADVKVVDNRDAMHKRGWTYFTVSGQINGRDVQGTGRIPFIYAASDRCWPWMKLRIGEDAFIDTNFIGFSRPWAGLHTMDTVRRDAARKQIPFETKLRADGNKAQIILTRQSGRVIYTIDIQRDVVEKIIFVGQRQGQLEFDYLQGIDGSKGGFAEPRKRYRTQAAFDILEIN